MYRQMNRKVLFAISIYCYYFVQSQNEVHDQSKMYDLEEVEKEMIVRLHNEHRSAVASGRVGDEPAGYIPDLKWDERLAKFAYEYMASHVNGANHFCPEDHNPNRCMAGEGKTYSVGENIAWGAPDLSRMMKSFVDEHINFVYPDKTVHDNAVIGHYTQVVWARTENVGCAVAQNCYINGTYYESMLLCNYFPPGNMMGEIPYYPDKPERQPEGTYDCTIQ